METGNKSSKRVMINEISQEDLISELPDHILVHILSFLPTRDAIKTVLLRRFGNLWRSVSVIDLNECSYHSPTTDYAVNFSRIIDRVSNLHEVGLLDKLSLEFSCGATHYSNEKMINASGFEFSDSAKWAKATSGRIEKLVSYAINRKVKILDLDFWDSLTLPVLSSTNSLINMRLVCCDINLWRETINYEDLRVLVLDDVVLCDDIIENILKGCPMLEDLSLIFCFVMSKLCCDKNSNLKRLRLDLYPYYELEVSCRHVTSLEINDWLPGATLLDVNSSLIDATITFYSFFYHDDKLYDGIQRLLHKISHGKTITLCGHIILMLTIWNSWNIPSASYQWKNITIKLGITELHYPGLSWLLESCQFVETLTIYIIREDSDYYVKFASEFIPHEFDLESYWDSQEARLPNLECIKIHGCVNKPNLDKMFKFLLRNATNLQKMLISIEEEQKECCLSQVAKLRHELLAFPRASSQAKIHVLC